MEYLVIVLVILAQLSHKEYRFSLVVLILLINPFLYAISVPSLSMVKSDFDSYTLYQRDIIIYGLVVLAFRTLSIDVIDVLVVLMVFIAVRFHYMGMGDLLLIAIGALCSDVFSLWLAILISSISATIYALVTKKRRLPFGPFIILGHLWVWFLL